MGDALPFAAAAFFMNLAAKPTIPSPAALAPGLESVAGAAAGVAGAVGSAAEGVAGAASPSYFKGFHPLRFILASMGISVDKLVEGSRKCVTELGPDAVGAVKMLLVSGAPATSLGEHPVHPPIPDRATPFSAPGEARWPRVGTGRTSHI